MATTFTNTGSVGIMGETIVNNGNVIGKKEETNIDWQSIGNEINILSSNGVEQATIDSLREAIAEKNPSLIEACLAGAKLTKKFLLSVGASLLAGYIMQ